jgi:flagellar motility protein MotE (MotC chaperone)
MRRAVAFFLILFSGMLAPVWGEKSTEGGEGEKKAEAPPPPRERAERVFTPTEAQLLLELEQQRAALERRAQALELREKLVDLMEQRLNGRVNELNTLKADLERLLANVSGKDDAEIKQLAALYGAMKPNIAATVLNRLDNGIVLDIFKQMPAKRSGKIMESLDPAKARFISELMAERTPPPTVSATTP